MVWIQYGGKFWWHLNSTGYCLAVNSEEIELILTKYFTAMYLNAV